MAPCCSIMINGFLRSYTCSLSLCVANLRFSSQLTKGRPKPQKVNRKNTGEKLAETRATRTHANSPHVSTSGTPIQSASSVAKPSQTPITPFRMRAVGTTFHADVSTQRCAHQPTSQADRPCVNTTNQWNEQALTGLRSSDPVRPNPNLQKTSFLAGIPYSSPDLSAPSLSPSKPSQARPSSASPSSPRRQGRIPSTGSRTLVMDVAQALQEAQTTAEAEVTAECSIPFSVPQQVEPPVLSSEKSELDFDNYSGRVMPSLAEEGSSARQGVNPDLFVQKETEINPEVKGQEQKTSPDSLPSVRPGTSCIEIRE